MRNYRMLQMREEKGYSQQELADLIGVTRQTINGIERGNVNPTIELVFKICKALGAEMVDELFPIPRDEEK